jgi:endoglucanase
VVDSNPQQSQAKDFFTYLASRYGQQPHIIYELWNEPVNAPWNSVIKPYAEAIIPAIRASDPDSVIVVGTNFWSQNVDEAANSPLNFPNIMYALHFYSGTHTQSLRDKGNYALNKGIALFVTEWGTSQADGGSNMQVYLNEAQLWTDWMKNNKISWANWSLCDVKEASAAIQPGASTTGGWSQSNLTPSGVWVRGKIRE